MGIISDLKRLGKTVSQGRWWMDSHGEALVCFQKDGGMETLLVPTHLREKAHRDGNTGGLSYWPNDSDASWIVVAQPNNILPIIERLEAAERERDELLQRISNSKIEREEENRFHAEGDSMLCGQYDDLAAAMGWSSKLAERQGISQLEYARQLNSRVMDLEAEIARRDAAVGEPVAVISEDSLAELKQSYRPVLVFRPDHKRNSPGISLYTAAQPAVLPWHVDSCSNCGSKKVSWDTTVTKATSVQDGRLKLNEVSGIFYMGCEECSETLLKVSADDVAQYLNSLKALGAQPQKPVVLPDPHAHLMWIHAGRGPDDYWDGVEVSRSEDDRCCDGSERYAVYSEFEVKAMLDAANIPYEVKK